MLENCRKLGAAYRAVLSGACVCLVLLFTLYCSSGEAFARNAYGAISYSFSGGAVGYSYNHPSRARAESDSLRRCRHYGGGCQVVLWFANSCGALAVSRSGYGAAYGPTRAAAQNHALRICAKYGGGCGIRAWTCTSR